MKITDIHVWQLELPLSKPYYLSGGRLKFECLDSTLVRLDTDQGVSGWGESCPWGNTYLPAHGAGARAAISTLAPAVLGRDPRALEDINRAMQCQLPGHPYAKSAIDIACWDILGKCTEQPLWRLMGAESANEVALNSSISTGDPDEMLALIEQARSAGYTVHSAKIGGDNTALDIARINAISGALPSDESVTFDVNRAWTPADALKVLGSVDSRDWIEQPCETLEQCRQVAKAVAQPVLLDECLHTDNDHLQAWKTGVFAGLKIKPNRLGGLTAAKRMRDLALSIGWCMHIEDVGGTALADTAAIHLASSTPEPQRLASWLGHAHLRDDPLEGQGARNLGGHCKPPELPGLCVEPDESLFGKPVARYR